MEKFKGKTAVVTGAASGVGKELVRTFCQQGMNVVMADINQEALSAAENELKESGLTATVTFTTDVTDSLSVEKLADFTFEKYGNTHILCNNAGVGLGEAKRRIWSLPDNDWHWGFAVNTFGVVNGIRHFVPRMLEMNEEGHIVNTSSANGGLTSLATTPIYASSKAAVTSLTEVLYYQLKQLARRIVLW